MEWKPGSAQSEYNLCYEISVLITLINNIPDDIVQLILQNYSNNVRKLM